jgi:two-component system, LytTR family, response regulator AlgR
VIEDPLGALEEEFGERFLRVHRDAIVASRRVRACDRDPAGHLTLRFDGVPDTVEVSRRLVAQVRRALSHLA